MSEPVELDIVRFSRPGQIAKDPAWRRSVPVDPATGAVFVPARIAGEEAAIALRTAHDGVVCIPCRRHLFLPQAWMAKNWPTIASGTGRVAARAAGMPRGSLMGEKKQRQAAAAYPAERILRERRARWGQALAAVGIEHDDGDRDWRAVERRCAQRGTGRPNAGEHDFLDRPSCFPWLSDRQAAVLRRLMRKRDQRETAS